MFDIPAAPTNPHIVFWIKCQPSNTAAPVTTGFGVPPDGKYRVYTTMSRDDFFYLYSGRAGPGAVSAMVLAGRIKVRWMRFADLGSFASSFVYSTPQWIAYYRRYGHEGEARRLVLSQWEKARASAGSGTPLVVDARGELIPRASMGEDGALALERAGRIYLGEEVEVRTPAVEEEVAEARMEVETAGGEEAAVQAEAVPVRTESPAEAAVEVVVEGAVVEPSSSDAEASAPGIIEPTPAAGAEATADVEAAASADAVESAMLMPGAGVEAAGAGMVVEAAPASAAEVAALEALVAEATPGTEAAVSAAVEPATARETAAEEAGEVVTAPVGVTAAAEDVPAALESEAAAPAPVAPPAVVEAAPEPLSAELEVDMMLLLPDLLAAAPLPAARAIASRLNVIAPSPVGGAVECLQAVGLTAALEPAFAAITAAHAEAELVQAALVQLQAVKSVLGPYPLDGAATTLETVVSSLRGGVRVVADVLTGDGGARATQLKLVELRETELGAREDDLRAEMRSGLDRIEGTLARVQSSVTAGVALAIIASSGFQSPSSGLGVGSTLADSAWLSATLGRCIGPLVGLPPWVAAALAHTSRRCADLKPAACSPAVQLASVAALAGTEWAPLRSLAAPPPPLPAALIASLGAAVRVAQGSGVGTISGQSGAVQGFDGEEAALTARVHATRRRVASAPRAPPAAPPPLPHSEPPPVANKGSSSWLGGGWLGLGGILAGGGSVLGTARAEGESGGSAPLPSMMDVPPPAVEAAPIEVPLPPPPAPEEAWAGCAWEMQAAEVAAGLRKAFGRHVSPLAPLQTLSLRAIHPRMARAPSWPALEGGPLLLPSWWTPALPPALTSTATAALLASIHARVLRAPASAWAVPDARHAETLAWCLGAVSLSPFSKPPVTFGAVGTSGGGGQEEEGDTHVTLLPLWRPNRLAASRRGEGRRPASSTPAPLVDAVLSVTNVMSPWRSKVIPPGSQPPSVYNGIGSGLYAATARERVRMQFEGALSYAAGDVARGSSGGDGSVAVSFGASRAGHRGMRVLLRRGVSVDDEVSFKYGQADESLQAVGPPVSALLEAPAASLRALVERIRAGGILKVYARANPLSVFTADRGEEAPRERGREEGGLPGAPPSGRL